MFLQRGYFAFPLRTIRKRRGRALWPLQFIKQTLLRSRVAVETCETRWTPRKLEALASMLSSSETTFSGLVQMAMPWGLWTSALRGIPRTQHVIVSVKTEAVRASPRLSAPKTQWKCHHTCVHFRVFLQFQKVFTSTALIDSLCHEFFLVTTQIPV